MLVEDFSGFPKEAPLFLKRLERNNRKAWFEAHRSEYDEDLLAPSRAFVLALGRELRKLSPGIQSIPKSGGSVFRIHRDLRFSEDKRPYKTHASFWFWEKKYGRGVSPGFYAHFTKDEFVLGTGVYVFERHYLKYYRQAVVDPILGPKLSRAVKGASKKGRYLVEGKHYKRVPAGFDPEHPNVDLLLHRGLFLTLNRSLPREFYTKALIPFCVQHFKAMLPLHRWYLEFFNRTPRPPEEFYQEEDGERLSL
jgi:uncharacterized protein (TIGR02453 family)